LLQKPDAEEAVFCGALASNRLFNVSLADYECLNPGEVLSMDYLVAGVVVEATFEPASPCEMGSIRPSDGENCSACAAGFYGNIAEASVCTACAAGA
jgi:hypothetical protein